MTCSVGKQHSTEQKCFDIVTNSRCRLAYFDKTSYICRCILTSPPPPPRGGALSIRMVSSPLGGNCGIAAIGE